MMEEKCKTCRNCGTIVDTITPYRNPWEIDATKPIDVTYVKCPTCNPNQTPTE